MAIAGLLGPRLTRRMACVSAALVAGALGAPAGAGAAAFLPPRGQVYAGLTGGSSIDPYRTEVRRHPAVFQAFAQWGDEWPWFFNQAEGARSRLMLHISTYNGPGTREVITPGRIAAGAGDGYLLWLGDQIATRGRPVYIRLMAEMNGNWNPYCAYDASGRSRGPNHSFRHAWQRTVLILRGGDVGTIDRRLRRLGLPGVRTGATRLPRAPVAFLWVPQVAGNPDTAANSPRAYWPGKAYVDWVGTDFYSKFPNWPGLKRFYRQFPDRPFVFGEWAVWGSDSAAFVRQLFGWVRSHPRVRMMVYNQGFRADGPFRLRSHPRAAREPARQLRSRRFPQSTSEWR